MPNTPSPDPVSVPEAKVGQAIEQVRLLAFRVSSAVLFNIRFRSDGVSLEWYDPSVQGAYSDWERGLVTYGTHPSLPLALAREMERLLSLATQKEMLKDIKLMQQVLRPT